MRHSREAGHGLVEGEVPARHQGGQGLDAKRTRLDLAFAHRLAKKPRGQRIPASAVLTQGPVALTGQLGVVKHVPLRGEQADGEVAYQRGVDVAVGSKIARSTRNIRKRAQLRSRRARLRADDARGKERIDGRAVTRDLRLPAARLVGGVPLPRNGEGGQVALGTSAHHPLKGEANAGNGGGRQVLLPLLHERECGHAVRVLGVYAQQRLGEVCGKRRGAPIVQGAAHERQGIHGSPIIGRRRQEACVRAGPRPR